MKRVVVAVALSCMAAASALAADLPPPAPPPPMPRAPAAYVPVVELPVYSWTGVYLGINGGYGFGSSTWTVPPGGMGGPNGGTKTFDTSGVLVGATLGGNYQMGAFVIGLEADGDWSDLNGSATVCSTPPCSIKTQSDWLATVRGRAGLAWDRVLFYGTGGAAFGNIDATYNSTAFTSGTQTGWTGGGGIEALLTPNWTAKVEYLYVDLGRNSCAPVYCGGIAASTVSLTENVVRAGINYKFGW